MQKVYIFEGKEKIGSYIRDFNGFFKSYLKEKSSHFSLDQAVGLDIPKGSWVFLPWPLKGHSLLEELSHCKIFLVGNFELNPFTDQDQNWSKVQGLLHRELHYSHHLPLLKQAFYSQEDVLISANDKMTSMMEKLQVELKRVKKIYSYCVPRRVSMLKGMKLISKYGAGSSGGGEFFDVLAKKRQILLMMSSCSSYSDSALVLDKFQTLSQYDIISRPLIEDISQLLYKEVGERRDLKSNLEIELFWCLISLPELVADIYMLGDFNVYSSDGLDIKGEAMPLEISDFSPYHHQVQLKRGLQLGICSPGLKKNVEVVPGGFDLKGFLTKSFPSNPVEVLDELYFQLNKGRESSFLAHDASCALLEIERHGLREV